MSYCWILWRILRNSCPRYSIGQRKRCWRPLEVWAEILPYQCKINRLFVCCWCSESTKVRKELLVPSGKSFGIWRFYRRVQVEIALLAYVNHIMTQVISICWRQIRYSYRHVSLSGGSYHRDCIKASSLRVCPFWWVIQISFLWWSFSLWRRCSFLP